MQRPQLRIRGFTCVIEIRKIVTLILGISIYCNAGIYAQTITLSLMESNINSCIISVYNDKNINIYIELYKISLISHKKIGLVVPKLRKNDIILNRD